MTDEIAEADPLATPELTALSTRMKGQVNDPDFPEYVVALQVACHGPRGRNPGCYWCFQIAMGSDLPSLHRYLSPPTVQGGWPRTDEHGDPVTADGRVHRWDATMSRILCLHCLDSDLGARSTTVAR